MKRRGGLATWGAILFALLTFAVILGILGQNFLRQ